MAFMYQVSTLQALAKGDFYSNATIAELLQHGDIGLGTFAAVDGEMVVLDGVCYRAKADGTVEIAAADAATPFASVTYLKKELAFDLGRIADMSGLLAKLDEACKALGENNIYACRIDGRFAEVYARSEMKQHSEPYKTFAKVLETDQREFEFKNVSGSLVCVYFPHYMDGLNVAGWHVHFISDDRTMGGHVFNCSIEEGKAYMGKTEGFSFLIPQTSFFQKLTLTDVSKEEIESVEKAGNK